MRMHRLLSVCSLAVVFVLGAASTTLADTFQLGVLTPTSPLAQSVIAPAGPVNDQLVFNFTVANGPLDVYAALVNGNTHDAGGGLTTGLLSSGDANSYLELFSGAPNGAHALVAGSWSELVYNASSNTVTGQSQTFRLAPGNYYLEVWAAAPGDGADFTVGLFGLAVPEPATWTALILGVAMIGFAARRRREALALAD